MSDVPAWENNVQELKDERNAVEAIPEGQLHSGQRDVDVVVRERPRAKVDPRKILVFLMVITKGSESYLVDNLGINSFKLSLEMVYHDYQSHFRIHARFDRLKEDINHITGDFHRIYMNLPCQAFDDVIEDFQPCKVEALSDIPEPAQKDPLVQKLFEQEFLYTVEFEVNFMHLVRLHSDFNVVSPGDDQNLQLLRKLDGKKTKIKILARMGNNDLNSINEFKIHLSREPAPLAPYYHKSGNYTISWGQGKEQEEDGIFSHKVEAQITYPTIAQWYITNVYGVLRNEVDALQIVKNIEASPRAAAFFEAPGMPLPNGMHRNYLVFLDVTDTEASSAALAIGQTVHVSWISPDERKYMDPQSSLWRGQVIPQLLRADAPGNLLLIITRPTYDIGKFEVNKTISSQMEFASKPVYLLPTDFDLPAKRLINALNLAHDGESEKYSILRRILVATDLSRIQFGQSLMEQEIYQAELINISLLEKKLSISQRIALNRVLESKNFIDFITGSFGTGKTSFIATLTGCLISLNKKVLLCCSSDFAIDMLASKIEYSFPGVKAIRFHGGNMETRAVDLKGQFHRKTIAKEKEGQEDDETAAPRSTHQGEQNAESRPAEETAPPQSTDQGTKTQESDDVASLHQALARLIPLSIFLAQAVGRKPPNFAKMSLMARCLAFAGLEGDKETPQANGDPHKHFRELFLRGSERDENFSKQFKEALERLQQNVFRNALVVLTTFSNAADKTLCRLFEPQWIIGDEVGATREAEFLIPICANIDSVEKIIGVGDAQQLPPVVKTLNKSRSDGTMINEFADSQVQPLILRLQLAGLQHEMLLECFRCTVGLEQPSSMLFYHNKVYNGPNTSLEHRPKSQKTVDFIRSEFGLETNVPRLVLDLQNGICLKASSGSRYNLHNVAQTLQLVEKLIEKGIFAPHEIAIQTPYRAQNACYRQAMTNAAKAQFWLLRKLNIWDLTLMTIDRFQGGERPCVIFDMVTATRRKGGLGFLQSRLRLNVAITRPQDALFVIADVNATLEQKTVTRALEQGEELDPESAGQDVIELQQGQNMLKKIVEFYVSQNCVRSIDIQTLKPIYLSFDKADQFAATIVIRCFNCQQIGHKKAQCTSATVPKASKSAGCKICGDKEHRTLECPERICNKCGEKGHFLSSCPQKKTIICADCGDQGHVRKDCPQQKMEKAKSCFICGRSDHQIKECPQLSHGMRNPSK